MLGPATIRSASRLEASAVRAANARIQPQTGLVSSPLNACRAIYRPGVALSRPTCCSTPRRSLRTSTSDQGRGQNGSQEGSSTSSSTPLLLFTSLAVGVVAINAQRIRADAPENASANEDAQTTETDSLVVSDIRPRSDQVKLARDAPGVWIWGNNRQGIVSPETSENTVKQPRVFSFFEGWVLKDLVLGEKHAAAIDLNGDLYQWGSKPDGSKSGDKPKLTITGRKLQKVSLAENKAYALSTDGSVYAISTNVSSGEANAPSSGSWFGLFGGSGSADTASIATLKLPAEARSDKIIDISAGLHHLLALGKSGRIYTIAADGKGNDVGQLGLNELDVPVPDAAVPESDPRWKTQMHIVELFSPVAEIASGNEHSVVRTKDGRAYAWGANNFGQLATLEFEESVQRVSYPREITTIWTRSASRSKPGKKNTVLVAAGGNNTIMIVEDLSGRRPANEVFSCGMGQWGQLGNGTYNHVQNMPVKIKPLSGLLEWDDNEKKIKPIGFNAVSIGATHVAAVLENVYTDVETKIEYGKDMLLWGMNTDFQLNISRDVKNNDGEIIGREKRRSNTSVPAYADPLPYQGADGNGRMQLAGKGKTLVKEGPGKGKEVMAEQAVVCGYNTTAVYTKAI